MKVLLVGDGAREHIIAEKLAQDAELYSVMSRKNPAIAQLSKKYWIAKTTDPQAVAEAVDEEIDPTNCDDVFFAMCTRVNIEKDIHIIKGLKSSTLDATVRKGTGEAFTNSVMIMDACKPYAWKDEFPKRIEYSSEIVEKVKSSWFSQI